MDGEISLGPARGVPEWVRLARTSYGDDDRVFLPATLAAERMGITEARVCELAKRGALRWQWSPDGPLIEPAVLSGDLA